MMDPVYGRIDPAGMLVAADSRLEKLNADAGGRLGEPVAVPAIARIARLANRLHMGVSRGATAADPDGDLNIWVDARPDGDALRLAVTGWTRRPARAIVVDRAASEDFARGASDWRWYTDDKLDLTRVTDGAIGMLGAEIGSFIGLPLTRLFSFVDEVNGELSAPAALSDRRGFRDQVAELHGTTIRVRLSAVPMTDERGRFAGFSGGATRIEPPSNLPSSASDKPSGGAFAARLDGALRTPLEHIIAQADDLHAQTEGPLRSEYAGYATDISSAARHLLSLVGDLVDLQAIEQPDFAPERETLDLADLARRAAGLLAVRADRADVRIERPGETEVVPATGEFRRVLQILVNLIGNAIRYSPPGGSISIRVERLGEYAGLTVEDQGKGIAPGDQARIFEKFERVDVNEPGGTGLGLYIARRLARAMSGELTVDSVPERGARFTLTLPRTPSQP